MAQLNEAEIIQRTLDGSTSVIVGVTALLDRRTARFTAQEGQFLDYKEFFSIPELGRDILGFSNSEGGLLLLGVDDQHELVGHEDVDFRRLRESLGPYIGTRIDFDLDEVPFSISGRPMKVIAVSARRSLTSYPNLLRKDIELRPGLVRKVKYIQGTLFYRDGDKTLAESPSGDVEAKARELGFSGAAPRTRTSFLLKDDRPGLRLYAPINDRFFGRSAETAELVAKFDDPRGRGVSIAGFGGVGKTELGIHLSNELHKGKKFQKIYSGSAKQTLLAPGGAQRTDPVFMDRPTFLEDLSGWLGFNPPRMSVNELEAACFAELRKLDKVLLFLDNLETVQDRSLFALLEEKLPPNCWLIATSRVHKLRNFIYPKELGAMEADDAAHLLRHELKRQGLRDLAATPIGELRTKGEMLHCHPLALRWFAWACRRRPETWTEGLSGVEVAEIESFCVAHTLSGLDNQTQKVLGAISAIEGTREADPLCIAGTAMLSESVVEQALWELECSGMVQATMDDDGVTTYSVAPMAVRPTADLARNQGWEAEYVQNLRAYVRQHQDAIPETPLIRDLVSLETRQVQFYSREEKQELIARIDRALPRCPDVLTTKLKWLKAEAHRHLGQPLSADDTYKDCAESVISQGKVKNFEWDKIRILLEAATVAKNRAPTEPQIRRAVSYLHAVEHTDFAHLRVLGMLTEYYAILGDRAKYDEYLRYATSYTDSRDYIRDSHRDSLDEALDRAKQHIERRRQ